MQEIIIRNATIEDIEKIADIKIEGICIQIVLHLCGLAILNSNEPGTSDT